MRTTSALTMLAAAAVLPLAACSSLPLACTAVGYIYSVAVTTDIRLPEGAALQVCIDQQCTVEGEAVDYTDASAVEIDRQTTQGWNVSFGMNTPDRLAVALLDAEGEEIARDEYQLEWVRTGGSERCGGPMETTPLKLTAS